MYFHVSGYRTKPWRATYLKGSRKAAKRTYYPRLTGRPFPSCANNLRIAATSVAVEPKRHFRDPMKNHTFTEIAMKMKTLSLLFSIGVLLIFGSFVKAQDKADGKEPIDTTINPADLTFDYLVDGNLPQY